MSSRDGGGMKKWICGRQNENGNICKYKCDRLSMLFAHQDTHNPVGDRRYQCFVKVGVEKKSHCATFSAQKNHIVEHVRAVHFNSETPHLCNYTHQQLIDSVIDSRPELQSLAYRGKDEPKVCSGCNTTDFNKDWRRSQIDGSRLCSSCRHKEVRKLLKEKKKKVTVFDYLIYCLINI